jgi:lipopolysaccharide/colanic/teichoic acid biosynthesis glycosyltransferase
VSGVVVVERSRPYLRRRPEKGLLVIGDGVVRTLASEAAQRIGRPVTAVVTDPADAADEAWDEVVIDEQSLERVRDSHPGILRHARRVWVVRDDAVHALRGASPFEHPLPAAGRAVKRALDILLALVGLLLALPVLLVAMLAVRADSRGPALFSQVRMGANGRRFRLYKLRTMYHGNDDGAHRQYVARLIAGAEERHGEVFKLVHDPRITRVGRILRQFSVDEVPQLWNVLKGDMSLVGPPPPPPPESPRYYAPGGGGRRVKPGITGLWQVSGRSALSFEEMVALDVRYWQRWSLWSDLAILLKTPRTVISGKGTA